jgi:hypothetical protein
MPDNSPSNPIEDLEAKLTGLAAEHSRIEDWNQAQYCWSGTHRAGAEANTPIARDMSGQLRALTILTPQHYVMDVRGRNGNVNAQVNTEFTEATDWAGLNKAYRWLASEGWNDMLGGNWVCPVEIDEFLSRITDEKK